MRGAMRRLCVLGLLIGTAAGRADERVDALLKKLPPGINSLVIINAQGIFDSKLAKEQQWATLNEKRFASGAGGIPPAVDLAVIGVQIDDQTLKARAEYGICALNRIPDMAALALRERGRVESINNVPSVESARNLYFGLFDNKTMGFMSPASRRDYAKWLRIAKSKDGVSLSGYLKEAAGIVSEAPVVVAIDAEDTIDELRAMHGLKGCSASTMPSDQMEACARTIASVRGLTFAVRVDDGLLGKVRIDFQKSARPLANNAKDIFVELLANNGMLIDDFKNWSANVDGSTVTLAGPMSAAGLKQVLSLVSELPSGTFEGDIANAPPSQPSDSAAQMNPQLSASQKYFKSTVSMLDELREFKAQTSGQNASMHERYALKIDRMPIYNVDDELLGWGASISNHLRAVAMSLRGANIEKGIIDAGRPTTGAYIGYGGWGIGTGGTVDSSAYWQARKTTVAKGTQARLSQWNEIDQETSDIRRRMVEKYKADF